MQQNVGNKKYLRNRQMKRVYVSVETVLRNKMSCRVQAARQYEK